MIALVEKYVFHKKAKCAEERPNGETDPILKSHKQAYSGKW